MLFKVPSNLIAPFSKLNTDPLDDKFDRLSSAISVYILIFCCILAGTKLYVGEPIQCFSPANVPGTWHDFYTAYCFIQPKSKIPKNFTVGYDDVKNLDLEVSFYPWVPYVLILQAICFYLPKFYWNATSSRFSIDLKSILKESKQVCGTKDNDERSKRVTVLASYTLSYLRYVYGTRCGILVPKAVFFYITKKFLYFVNAFAQFYFITHFIGKGNYLWGVESLSNIISHEPWSFSLFFPRLVHCDIGYVQDAQDKGRTVPCILGMNVVFEKVFTFLYFWILFIMVVTLLDAVYSLVLFGLPAFRSAYLNSQLKKCGINAQLKFVMSFMENVLHCDGMLMLKLIEKAYGSVVAETLLYEMWETKDEVSSMKNPKIAEPKKEFKVPTTSKDLNLYMDHPGCLDYSSKSTDVLLPGSAVGSYFL